MEKSNLSREQILLIEMVMRQTILTFDETKEQLEINNNNYMIVIKEALGIKEKKDTEIKSINQQIYTEIRGLMDNASDTYRKNKEYDALESQKRKIYALKKKAQYKNKLTCINEVILPEND